MNAKLQTDTDCSVHLAKNAMDNINFETGQVNVIPTIITIFLKYHTTVFTL